MHIHVTTWVQRDARTVTAPVAHLCPERTLFPGISQQECKPHRAAVFLTWTLVQEQNKITSTQKKDLAQPTALSDTESQAKGSHKHLRYHQHPGYSPGPAIPIHSNITSANIMRTAILYLFVHLSFLHSFIFFAACHIILKDTFLENYSANNIHYKQTELRNWLEMKSRGVCEITVTCDDSLTK